MTISLGSPASDDGPGRLHLQATTGILLAAPDFRPIGCDPAFGRLLGYDPSRLTRMRVEDLIAPQDAYAGLEAIKRLLSVEVGVCTVSLRWRHFDGRDVQTQVRAIPLRGSNGVLEAACLVLCVADDGPPVAGPGALSKPRDRLAQVIADAPVTVAMFDRDMRYVACSRRWMAEYVPHGGDLDLTGRSHFEVIPDQPEAWREAYRRALAGEVVSEHEDRFERADGCVLWLNWEVQPFRSEEGSVAGLLIFTEDVTARRQIQESLHGRQGRLDVPQAAAGFGTFEMDLGAGEARWSDEALEAAGLARDEVPVSFEEWGPLVEPADLERLRQAWAEACDPNGPGRFSVEVGMKGAAGSRCVQILGLTQFQHTPAGQRAARILGVAVDQTRARRMQAALAESQRVETVGRLAGVVAHDFNNLLSVIQANLELAELEAGDGPLRTSLERAREGSEMGASFVRRLLSLAGNREPRPQVVSPVARLAEAWQLLSRALGKMVTVRLDTALATWPVLIDPGELEGSLLNLTINARDALLPGGGEIVISTANATLSAEAARGIPGGQAGDWVRVSVADAGAGMSTEVAARALEPFFTTKPPGRGTGLGLTSVAGVAARAGGFVEIASRLGEGTRVTMWLPRHEGLEDGRGMGNVMSNLPRGDGELVLVVEDDTLVREAVLKRLEMLGYAVLEASDAAAALRLMEAGEPVDVLFSDVVMPGGMSGYDLAAEARRRWPAMATLLTSGYAADLDLAEPAFDLLPKPYGLPALALSVRRALTARPPPAEPRR